MPHEIFEGVATVVSMDGAPVRLKANCRADAGRLRMAKVPPARIIALQLGQGNELKAEKTKVNPISEAQPVEGL
jgi:hypothetical protein